MIQTRAKQLAAIGLAATLLLTGCGRESGGGESAEPGAAIKSGPAKGNLTVWAQGAEAEALPALLKEFEAANPGVKVKVTALPWPAAHNKYQTAIAGGTTPDIAQMGTTWMADFENAFDATPSEIDSSGFFPGSVKSTEVNGTKYGVPWYVDTRVVYYRTDLAKKAGYTTFPTNWDDFKAMAKAMQTKAGAKYGVQLPSGAPDSFQGMLSFPWSNDAELLSKDGKKWTLDTPEMTEAMKYYQSFFKEGIADKNQSAEAGAKEAAFVDGTVPMFMDGPFDIGLLADAGGKGFADKYTVAKVPKQKSATSFIGGSNLVVFKKSKNRDSAWKLLQWLSKPEVQLKWYKATGDLPAFQDSWKDQSLSGDDKLSVFGEQLKDTKTPPALTAWTQIAAAADRQIEQMIKAGKDPGAAMKDLQKAADSAGTGN